MAEVLFDTHPFIKQLIKVGIPETHAETQVKTMNAIMRESLDNKVATKHDLQLLEASIHRDMSELKSELKSEFKQDIANLTVKMAYMSLGSATLFAAVLKLISLM